MRRWGEWTADWGFEYVGCWEMMTSWDEVEYGHSGLQLMEIKVRFKNCNGKGNIKGEM